MTDNKRFMIDDSGELIDLNIPKFVDWGDDVCELLNQLANENEELNNEIYDWKTSAEDYKKLGQSLLKENGELKQRVNLLSDEITAQGIVIEGYQDRNKKLFEENEQLKQENQELRHFKLSIKAFAECNDNINRRTLNDLIGVIDYD